MRTNAIGPKLYMNKSSGALALLTEWWEPLTIDYDEKLFAEIAPELKSVFDHIKIAKGTLTQVGWLLENGHGVWIGINNDAIQDFEYIGEVD